MTTTTEKINPLHLDLLKQLRALKTEAELQEVRSLLAKHFEEKLLAEIDRVEAERGYTAETYEQWAGNTPFPGII